MRTDFAKAENDSLFLHRHLSSVNYNASFIEKSKIKKLFRQALDTLKPGEVSRPVMDNGVVYIIKKEGEKGNKVKFSVMARKIIADPVATIDKQSGNARDFRYFAKNSSSFKKEAQKRGLTIHTGLVTKGNTFIAGLGQSRQISNMIANAQEGVIKNRLNCRENSSY